MDQKLKVFLKFIDIIIKLQFIHNLVNHFIPHQINYDSQKEVTQRFDKLVKIFL